MKKPKVTKQEALNLILDLIFGAENDPTPRKNKKARAFKTARKVQATAGKRKATYQEARKAKAKGAG